jgi:beta-galactosidase
VRAVLSEHTPLLAAGHEIAWCQESLPVPGRLGVASRPTPEPVRPAPPPASGWPLEHAEFDPLTGRLLRLGDLRLKGPRLDLWRAPTDNDRGLHEPIEPAWRALGLHRIRHRTISIESDDAGLLVCTRVAPAAVDLGLLATYRWTPAPGGGLNLSLAVEPEGDWSGPIPRLGLLLELPAAIGEVEWFGYGPGEAYSDSRAAVRVGRYRHTVQEWQTPYVYPQENGNRVGVRWARLTGPDGSGLRVDGHPAVELSVRRWTSADLDAARHTTDLVARDAVYLNLDVAQNGLGSASCGPGVLPHHEWRAAPLRFAVTLTPLAAP